MKSSKVRKMNESVWLDVWRNDDFQVEIVPGRCGAEWTAAQVNQTADALRELARRAIVGFKGYQDDDGNELKNTLEHRMEIAEIPAVQFAILARVGRENAALVQGEELAVSD